MTTARSAVSAPRILPILVAVLALLAVSAPPTRAALDRVLVEDTLSLPVFLTHAGDSRLFVVEQDGLIKILTNGTTSTFLNLTTKTNASGERGLLGLAFHPDYAANGLLYAIYTRASDGDLVLAEYERSAGDPDSADLSSERIVLMIEHSSPANHNGGTIMFKGNYLYWSTGDGGAGQQDNAQDVNSLLGKILRIDPTDPDGAGGADYSIPASNPFVGVAGRDEIWALGLRNPYRCSIDGPTGYLWCGDVGEGSWEEIDRKGNGKGVNFGWPLLEGNHYFDYPGQPSGERCTSGCRSRPILAYAHAVSGEDNNTVVGGYVARRPGRPLTGKYIFGDFGSGRVWAIRAGFDRGDSLPAPLANTTHTISSFGVDNLGRVYLVDYGGSVWRLTGT